MGSVMRFLGRHRVAIVVVITIAVITGGLWIRHARSWAEPIAYAAPPGEQTGPAPAPNASWRKDKGTFVGNVELSGGRTGFNDRELVLGSAGPPPREASPEAGCGQDIEVVVVEDTPERVVLQARAYAGPNERAGLFDRTDWMCAAMRYQRTTFVQLAEPLAGRAVHTTATDDRLAIADGSRLLVPGWLPDGYQLMGETVGTFTYTRRPVSGPSTEGNVDGFGLSISQGPRLALAPLLATDDSPAGVDAVVRRLADEGQLVTVRGVPAAFVAGTRFLPRSLVWHEGDDWLSISYRPTTNADDHPPTSDELLRIAESLHLVGR